VIPYEQRMARLRKKEADREASARERKRRAQDGKLLAAESARFRDRRRFDQGTFWRYPPPDEKSYITSSWVPFEEAMRNAVFLGRTPSLGVNWNWKRRKQGWRERGELNGMEPLLDRESLRAKSV
jgi:hypothetical protein